MPILISLCAFIATFLGGLFALRFKDKLHLILGFSAGAVIGVAFFDLLPESLEMGSGFYSISALTSIVALGFIGYMILDRLVIMHSDHHDHDHGNRGTLGAGSLVIHSFLDGAAIGLAFQVSAGVGLIVAAAVLMHDFSDGINTVNFILKNHGNRRQALQWLIIDACAPILGVISTLFFSLPESYLSIILGLFTGFFLYIGASDLLPESHHSHPTTWTTVMTIIGFGLMYVVIQTVAI